MGGAIAVYLPAYLLVARRRRKPLFGARWYLPAEDPVDGRLLAGSAVFGIGWGLVGYCPGPAVVSLATGAAPLLFIAGMVGAQIVYEVLRRAREMQSPETRRR
jgi:hypothetical protein